VAVAIGSITVLGIIHAIGLEMTLPVRAFMEPARKQGLGRTKDQSVVFAFCLESVQVCACLCQSLIVAPLIDVHCMIFDYIRDTVTLSILLSIGRHGQ
jgi:hypothetical protein